MGYQGPSLPLTGKCWNTNITVHIETSFILPRSVKVVTKKEAPAPKSTPLQLPMWKSLMPSGEKFLRQRLNHSSLKQKQIQHNNIYMQVLKTCMSLTTLKNIYFACFINANFSKVFYEAIILLLILLLTAKQVFNKVK